MSLKHVFFDTAAPALWFAYQYVKFYTNNGDVFEVPFPDTTQKKILKKTRQQTEGEEISINMLEFQRISHAAYSICPLIHFVHILPYPGVDWQCFQDRAPP